MALYIGSQAPSVPGITSLRKVSISSSTRVRPRTSTCRFSKDLSTFFAEVTKVKRVSVTLYKVPRAVPTAPAIETGSMSFTLPGV